MAQSPAGPPPDRPSEVSHRLRGRKLSLNGCGRLNQAVAEPGSTDGTSLCHVQCRLFLFSASGVGTTIGLLGVNSGHREWSWPSRGAATGPRCKPACNIDLVRGTT